MRQKCRPNKSRTARAVIRALCVATSSRYHAGMAYNRQSRLILPGAILALGLGLLAFDPGNAVSNFRYGVLDLFQQLNAMLSGEAAPGPQTDRPDWAYWTELVFLLAAGTGFMALLARTRLASVLWVGAMVVTLGLIISWALFAYEGVFLDLLIPSLALVLAGAVAALASTVHATTSRRRVRTLFSSQLSPVLISRIAADPSLPPSFDDQTRTITFLSCHLLGATRISEKFENQPAAVTELVRQFTSCVAGAILRNGGTLDRQAGTRITGFWNAPADDPEHARKACKAALNMLKGLPRLQKLVPSGTTDQADEQPGHLKIAIGINTGRSIVGNIAHDGRFDYSAVGEVAEHAARLHRQSENYGLSIIVAEETRRFVPDLPLIELDRVTARNRKEPTKIYGLMQSRQVPSDSAYQAHQLLHSAMLYAYRHQHWQEAKDYLKRCQDFSHDLGRLYDLYASRIEFYDSAPPGSGWDGTLTATRR